MQNIFTELNNDVTIPSRKPVAEVEHDGFTYYAKLLYDEDGDISYLGEFSDTPEENAIAHDAANPHGVKWFNPYNCSNDKEREENYKRALEFGNTWAMFGAVVTVHKEGVELGSASLWGIESDSEQDYFISTFNELASEALTEAKATLEKLCKCA